MNQLLNCMLQKIMSKKYCQVTHRFLLICSFSNQEMQLMIWNLEMGSANRIYFYYEMLKQKFMYVFLKYILPYVLYVLYANLPQCSNCGDGLTLKWKKVLAFLNISYSISYSMRDITNVAKYLTSIVLQSAIPKRGRKEEWSEYRKERDDFNWHR